MGAPPAVHLAKGKRTGGGCCARFLSGTVSELGGTVAATDKRMRMGRVHVGATPLIRRGRLQDRTQCGPCRCASGCGAQRCGGEEMAVGCRGR